MPCTKKYNRWTYRQLTLLRKSYPTATREKLAVEFAPHTIDSIRKMASQLKIRKRRYWLTVAAAHTPIIFAP